MTQSLPGAPFTAFPTVDEMHTFCSSLAVAHPDRVELSVVGESRAGDPVQLLTIRGRQERGSVITIGMPHPNEPIGMLTIMAMCRLLLSDSAPSGADTVAWHFVPCADPDGTRLNEGWFRGPFTREHYARHFYRPGSEAQVEWTFPLEVDPGFSVNRPLPETRALMRGIEVSRPTVLASLHNGEMGGAYFYSTPGAEALYPRLTALCEEQGIPLHLGEPEFPMAAVFTPAVYGVPTGRQLYELATAMGVDPHAIVTGGNSLDFARTVGLDPVGVVVELPYWRDDQAADATDHPSGVSRREMVAAAAAAQKEAMTTLRLLMDRAAPLPESPFRDAVASFLDLFDTGVEDHWAELAESDPDSDRPATVAETFSARDELHSTRLRLAGMLHRAVPEDSPIRAEVEDLLTAWTDESAAESKASAIPLDRLVAVQMGSIFAAVDHVHGLG